MTLTGLIATAAATPALAYWTSTGSGSAGAATGTLAAPTGVTVPAAAAPNVAVSWAAGAGGVPPTGYFVTRSTAMTTAPACGTSPTSPILALSCTDSAVPDGTFTYVVTAVSATWTARSSASGTVTVENVARVAFVVQPTDTVAGAPITPALTVALRTAAGNPYPALGVSVTIGFGANPGAGILSGTTTALTDANGVATFGNLSISKAGVGYTLTATSAGVTSGASAPFTVLTPPILGAAQSFSVLAETAVVNTGVSTVSGDVGVSPGTSITGFPVGSVGGDMHQNDAIAMAAQAALVIAYDELRARPAGGEIIGDLGGRTLTAGVYHSTAALALTGTLTLDAAGDPEAIFVFQSDAAFDTAASSTVVLINGAQAANVYWTVAGAAGTGASTSLSGSILAKGAITLGAGTVLIGRALSRDAVTLASTTIRFTAAPPPTININGGNTVTTKDTTPVIAGTSNAPPSSPVTVRIAGQTLTTTVGSDGTWSVTATTLPAGTYDVVASVRDPAGNGTAITQVLTVEVNPATVNLANAGPFAVLASTVTNTGTTSVKGDVGVSPNGTVVGLSTTDVTGTIHVNDSAAADAEGALLAAITEVFARTPHTQIVGDLGGRTFHIGIHRQTAAMALTGSVTLDAEGNQDAVFIFVTDAAFNTAAASNVVLANGAQAANVYWVVGDAAGTGANSFLSGTVLARGAITLGASTQLTGRALSRGVVTLAGNPIMVPVPAGFARMQALPQSADESAFSDTTDQTPAPPTDSATVPVSSTETTPAPTETTQPPPAPSAGTTPDVTPETMPESAPETTPESTPETPAPVDPCAQETAETPPPTTSAAVPPAETTSDVTPSSTPPAEQCPTAPETPLVESALVTSPVETLDQPTSTPPELTPGSEPPAPTTGTSTSAEVTTP